MPKRSWIGRIVLLLIALSAWLASLAWWWPIVRSWPEDWGVWLLMFGLPFFALVVLFWPVRRHPWYWGWVIIALVACFLLMILAGLVSSYILNPLWNVQIEPTLILIWVLNGEIMAAILLVRLFHPPVWQNLFAALRAELGEPPGAIWLAILWGSALLALFSLLIGPLIPILSSQGIFSKFPLSDGISSGILLIIACSTAAGYRLGQKSSGVMILRRVSGVRFALLVGVIVYFFVVALTRWASGLDGGLPQPVGIMQTAALDQFAWTACLALAYGQRRGLAPLYRMLVVGALGGALLSIAWAYPAYSWVYSQYVPGSVFAGLAHERLFWGSFLAGALLALVIGPLAAAWARPSTVTGRFLVGAGAGGLAGALLFAIVGGALAGVAGQSSLYDFALSRTGYEGDRWVLHLALACLWNFPSSYLTTAGMSLGGALLSGLGGLLVFRRAPHTPVRPGPYWALPLLSFAAPLLLVNIVFLPVIWALLPDAIENVFVSIGINPPFSPQLILYLVTSVLLLSLAGIEAVGLWQILRWPAAARLRRLAAALALGNGALLSFGLPPLLWLLDRSFLLRPEMLALTLALAALGVELWVAGWRLWHTAPSIDQHSVPVVRSDLQIAGLVSGLLANIPALPLLSSALSLVMVSIVMIVPMANTGSAAPGLPWLHATLQSLFRVTSWVLLTTLNGGLFLGLVGGELLARWPWAWVVWLWEWLLALVARLKRAVGRVERRWLWLLALLGDLVLCTWAWKSYLFLALFSMSLAWLALRRWGVQRLGWPGLALADLLAGAGLAGLALRGASQLPDASSIVSLVYLLLVGPAWAIALQALLNYTAPARRPALRLALLAGCAGLVGLVSGMTQPDLNVRAGVLRFDGQDWQAVSAQEGGAIGDRVQYRFFTNRQGRLWYGNGLGRLGMESPKSDIEYLLIAEWPSQNSADDLAKAEAAGRGLSLLQGSDGRLWGWLGEVFGQFDPQIGSYLALRWPGRILPAPQAGQSDQAGTCLVGAFERIPLDGSPGQLYVLPGSADAVVAQTLPAQMLPAPNGEQFVTLRVGVARLWLADGHPAAALQQPYDIVNGVTFRSDGERLATANQDSRVHLWDRQGDPVGELPGSAGLSAVSAVFAPDGQRLLVVYEVPSMGAAPSEDSTAPTVFIRLWDEHGALLAELQGRQAHFTAAGSRILTFDSNSAWLWDDAGHLLAEWPDRFSGLQDIALSEDGRLIALASDGRVQIWDTHERKLAEYSALEKGSGSPSVQLDGDRLLVSTGGSAHLLSALDGQEVARFDGPPAFQQRPGQAAALSAQFSPDGRWVLALGADGQVRTWGRDGRQVAAVQSQLSRVESAALSPDGSQLLLGGCLGAERYVRLAADAPLNGLAEGPDGDLWLATSGDGVYRVESELPIEDTTWQHFTTQENGLPSDQVRAIYADRQGRLWLGTDQGLSVFSGETWQPIDDPDMPAGADVQALLQDSRDGIWAASRQGVHRWDGQRWTRYEILTPQDGSGVQVLFEDSQGGVWAGVSSGAWRFDGAAWARLVPVDAAWFAEAPSGVVWVGGSQGVTRYSMDTGDQALFSSSTRPDLFPTDQVSGLHVDAQENLWVSLYKIDVTQGLPGQALALNFLFFAGVFAYTYRGYQRSSQTQARRLRRSLQAQPIALLTALYSLLHQQADAGQVLNDLLELENDRPAWKSLAGCLAQICASSQDADLNAWQAWVEALNAASDFQYASELGSLHAWLLEAAQAASTFQLAAWPVQVLRGDEQNRPMLVSETCQPLLLPPLVGEAVITTLEAFQQAALSLVKYTQVEQAADKLSYLADALGAVERALVPAQVALPPEQSLLSLVARRWRELVNQELNAFSGQADLRLELRTRQAHRAPQVTVAVQIKNVGRSIAENIHLMLLFGEDEAGGTSIERTLPRLSADASELLDFSLAPGEDEQMRLVWRLAWDDRAGAGHSLEFADTVSFYERREAFRLIQNPYIPGPPVKDARLFMGREDVFQFIQENLSSAGQKRTLVLHGQRRTGKTSILYQLLGGRLGKSLLPVLVDMQEVAPLVQNLADFLSELAYKFSRTLHKAGLEIQEPALEVFNVAPLRVFNRFLDDLEERLAGRQMLVMFDEFELLQDLIQQGLLGENLLGYIRSLIQHRECLLFIFTGTHRLEEMGRDYWSIFFNITLYRKISFLSRAEAERLVREPVAGALSIDDLAVEKMIALTRAHPYFLQLLCWALVNHANANRRNYVTLNDVNDVLQEIILTGEPYFAYIWQQANSIERLALAGLAHTLQAGKHWARPEDILDTLAAGGDMRTGRADLLETLDRLVQREVLETASEGALRYRFQVDLLRHWMARSMALSILVERGK